MAAVRMHRYTLDPANLAELIARRATLLDAIRAAHPGLAEARLTRLEDGTFTDVWRWESAEQMRAALGGMSRVAALAGAAWSLTRSAAPWTARSSTSGKPINQGTQALPAGRCAPATGILVAASPCSGEWTVRGVIGARQIHLKGALDTRWSAWSDGVQLSGPRVWARRR
jgi:hypothetical protein